MKKSGLLIFFYLLLVTIVTAQDIRPVFNKTYTSYFSVSKHIPRVVAYTLTKEMISCRGGKVKDMSLHPDPQLLKETDFNIDYANAGFVPAFCMSLDYNLCDKAGRKEAFYFTNIVPRPKAFNDGLWGQLQEEELRQVESNDTIKVFTGNAGESWSFGPHNITVPKYCWKVIYIPKLESYLSYVFPNEVPVDDRIYTDFFKPDVTEVEKLCNCSFDKGQITFD